MNRFSSLNVVPTPCHLLKEHVGCGTAESAGAMGCDGCRDVKGRNNDANSLKSEVLYRLKVTWKSVCIQR